MRLGGGKGGLPIREDPAKAMSESDCVSPKVVYDNLEDRLETYLNSL
jgi:hypothetical protein